MGDGDPAWLLDPARKLPITIDPTYAAKSVGPSFDTFAQEGFSSDQSAGSELKVGTYNGSTVARSYLNFPQSGFNGLRIVTANLSLYETYSYSCTAAAVYAHSSGAASTATNWANQPAVNSTAAGSVSVAKGYSSSCAAGRIDIPITALAQSWSTSTAPTVSVALKASETSVSGWKRFASSETSNDPVVSITYNRARTWRPRRRSARWPRTPRRAAPRAASTPPTRRRRWPPRPPILMPTLSSTTWRCTPPRR